MMQKHRCPTPLLLSILILSTLLSCTYARRGALVRDGMSSKQAYDNPLLGKPGDITIDPDVVAITTRCSKWSLDPIDCNTLSSSTATSNNNKAQTDEEKSIIKQVVSKEMLSNPLQITFRSKTLGSNAKRPNWMRASATLGNPSSLRTKPLRAVWTCSNADADTSMTYEELNKEGRVSRREIGSDVLNDSYEECLKRLYGKYVELEVLLPRTKGMIKGAPPPSVVYRVPIQGGSVNPLGMVSKSRATVTLYPKGRTLAAANASGPSAAVNVKRDVAIPLGLSNVHVPLGPGLVDPSWSKGRKIFWKGRSVGLV